MRKLRDGDIGRQDGSVGRSAEAASPDGTATAGAYGCRASTVADAQVALNVLGGKWVVPIIGVLAARPHRHGELQRALGPALHQKVLTETLRRMEAARLLDRRVVAGVMPPPVVYLLTDFGASLLEPIEHLAAWAGLHEKQLRGLVDDRARRLTLMCVPPRLELRDASG